MAQRLLNKNQINKIKNMFRKFETFVLWALCITQLLAAVTLPFSDPFSDLFTWTGLFTALCIASLSHQVICYRKEEDKLSNNKTN